jgi:tRNA acetyltransferase TAN1
LGLSKLFNLIVAHEPGYYASREAMRTIRSVLGAVRLFAAPQSLLLLSVDDPYKAVAKLARELTDDSVILRAIPLDAVSSPYLDDVDKTVKKTLQEKYGSKNGKTFAIRLEGHLVDNESGRLLHKDEAIRYLAKGIELPVNLDNPDILILVKIVRASKGLYYAGIMVAPPCSIYSRAKGGSVCIEYPDAAEPF